MCLVGASISYGQCLPVGSYYEKLEKCPSPSELAAAAATQGASAKGGDNTGMIVGAICGVIAFVALVAGCVYYQKSQKPKPAQPIYSEHAMNMARAGGGQTYTGGPTPYGGPAPYQGPRV